MMSESAVDHAVNPDITGSIPGNDRNPGSMTGNPTLDTLMGFVPGIGGVKGIVDLLDFLSTQTWGDGKANLGNNEGGGPGANIEQIIATLIGEPPKPPITTPVTPTVPGQASTEGKRLPAGAGNVPAAFMPTYRGLGGSSPAVLSLASTLAGRGGQRNGSSLPNPMDRLSPPMRPNSMELNSGHTAGLDNLIGTLTRRGDIRNDGAIQAAVAPRLDAGRKLLAQSGGRASNVLDLDNLAADIGGMQGAQNVNVRDRAPMVASRRF